MTRLADLVDTSERIGADASRRAKIAHIAALLRQLAPDEIDIGVAYLAGLTPQGKSGVGWALIRAASAPPAGDASLALAEVDAALARIARTTGAGSTAERTRLLSSLFAKATAREQEFLARLLLGELRQGALEGLMIEAVAVAGGLPGDMVRRAAMVAGGVAAIAKTALNEGASGLSHYAIALFQPLAPMLAQSANDIADAFAQIPAAAVEWK